jgi:hypothetical protein
LVQNQVAGATRAQLSQNASRGRTARHSASDELQPQTKPHSEGGRASPPWQAAFGCPVVALSKPLAMGAHLDRYRRLNERLQRPPCRPLSAHESNRVRRLSSITRAPWRSVTAAPANARPRLGRSPARPDSPRRPRCARRGSRRWHPTCRCGRRINIVQFTINDCGQVVADADD